MVREPVGIGVSIYDAVRARVVVEVVDVVLGISPRSIWIALIDIVVRFARLRPIIELVVEGGVRIVAPDLVAVVEDHVINVRLRTWIRRGYIHIGHHREAEGIKGNPRVAMLAQVCHRDFVDKELVIAWRAPAVRPLEGPHTYRALVIGEPIVLAPARLLERGRSRSQLHHGIALGRPEFEVRQACVG